MTRSGVDLACLETGDLDAKVETKQRKILELLREQPVIPDGDFGEPVIGDPEGAGLFRAEVIEAQRRHLSHIELAAGGEATVAADYVVVAIDQDRDIEAEGLDAVGDLSDLLFAVAPRVRRIRFQLSDAAVGNRHSIWNAYAGGQRNGSFH